MSSTQQSLDAETKQKVEQFGRQVRDAIAQVVVGMDEVLDQFLIAMLVGGHALIEGVPGTAKTTLAKAFARVLGIVYQRVQFTPDLLPSDITGTYIYDKNAGDFALRKGPVFCQLLLADEVNRAPAKTQAALLEAMQEHQVTIEGKTLPLPRPFFVLATQNPVEQEGVYRLPEAQLDRFLIRVEIGYLPRDTEMEILKLHGGPSADGHYPPAGPTMPEPIATAAQVLDLQGLLPLVYAEPTLLAYVVDLARASRSHADVALGASPRAAVNLLQCARARALLAGRHYATHEDAHAVAHMVWGHRIILRPESEIEGQSVANVIAELLEQVPVLKH